MSAELTTNQLNPAIVDELTGNPLDSVDSLFQDEPGARTISIDSVTGAPGSTVTVPVLVSDATNVVSLNLLFTYDATLLSIPDPIPETAENEGIRRGGVSQNWVLPGGGDDPDSSLANPVANVNQETGEVSVSLVKTTPEPTQGSGVILTIDFQIAADAALETNTAIDLQASREGNTSRIGVGNEDLALTDSVLNDGDLTVGETSPIELFRFRNTTFDTGTYVFVGEAEKDAILADPNLSGAFALDGVNEDGTVNPAFIASTQPADDLLPFFRLRSLETPGTFLFVSTEEYNAIFAEGSDQRDKWEQEGLNTAGEDIPEFYLFGVGAGQGTEFNRFQNRANNTFLFAGPDETAAINNNPDLSGAFRDQGPAFESLI